MFGKKEESCIYIALVCIVKLFSVLPCGLSTEQLAPRGGGVPTKCVRVQSELSMCTAIRAVSHNGVNLCVRVLCEPFHIAVVRSNFMGELKYSVDLSLYFNLCRAAELYQFVCMRVYCTGINP